MLKLDVVVTSTRPGRAGLPIGRWFDGLARADGRFEVALVDLAVVNLPLLDEPRHPRLRQYEHAHTKAWSATVDAADAFVFVTPEYNHACPPALLNALDFLSAEWAYKPAAFVSYGGVSGGLRAAQVSKLALTALKMMPIPEQVALPMFSRQLVDGAFEATPENAAAATAMLGELHRWATALRTMRAPT